MVALGTRGGGRWGAGDMEDIVVEGKRVSCIRCPWHHYLMSLEDGHKWYAALDKDPKTGQLVPAGWKASDEPLQRTFSVREENGQIFLRITGEDRRSDKYAFRSDCAAGLGGGPRAGRRQRTNRSSRVSHVGGDGRIPSGRIFSWASPAPAPPVNRQDDSSSIGRESSSSSSSNRTTL